MNFEFADAELTGLIGLIYEAVIDPDRWHEALDAIRARFNFYNSMMTVLDASSGRGIINVMVNVPPLYAAMHDPERVASVVGLWGGPERLLQQPLEEPMVLSEASDPANWDGAAYYQDFAKPQGIFDVVAILLVRDNQMVGNVGFGRHHSAGRPSVAEVEGMRMLAPHIRRAALISGILDEAMTQASTFEAALDATGSGVVLLDAAMRIVHANSAAAAMIEGGDPNRSTAGTLELREELAPGRLRQAVEAAAGGGLLLGRRGIGIPTRRRDGSPLVVHVMPLAVVQPRPGISPRAVAAIFVADRPGPEDVPAETLELLFGLTPAESRVFELIAAGHSSGEAAQIIGIAPSTFKTHLLRVFDKTGRHGRAELMQLGREISLPGPKLLA